MTKDVIELAQKYILAAQKYDEEGLIQEAQEIDNEILFAIQEKILPIALKVIKTSSVKNTRTAIRGQSDWNDYLQNMATGAGGAAGTAIGSGFGAATAPLAAGLGAGLGAAGTWGGDLFFNKVQGATSQLESLGNDLATLSNSLAQKISEVDPTAAQNIISITENLQKHIGTLRDQKRREISEGVGLDPDKGFLQSLNPANWGKVLNRKWQMTTSSNKNQMIKESAQNDILDSTNTGAGLSGALTKQKANLFTGSGLTGGAMVGGLIGGGIGAGIGRGGYDWIANKVRGEEGILQKYITDIQKIGAALANISQTPGFMNYTQQIASLAQNAIRTMQQQQQSQTAMNMAQNSLPTVSENMMPMSQYTEQMIQSQQPNSPF